ncbi:SpoVK/Ycf46/Vps4 family AAA+-type ATPase [Micromonospora sp. M71_S20]|uniref:AAA family ATPase n=1 Tax=Micromonospora sp. M71_S20 TaxID=592872 RepID=UPI000EB0C944|nr:AAA family ATPase [Micromonospora sp. M71_S20]RLK23315.1 SpoVK/Ycf46/Vps4 family AAA+-type ATPase [Micromonospora sp. M71_S20]
MVVPFRDALSQMLKARFPVLYVESSEEQRVVAEVCAVAQDATLVRTPRAVWTWSLTTGLVQPDGVARKGTTDPDDALAAALRLDHPSVLIFKDLHPAHGGSDRPGTPGVVRRLRDVVAAFKAGPVPRTLVLVSPVLHIPVELEKDVTIVDFPLPTETEIRRVLDGMIAANSAGGRIRIALDDLGRERLAKAALGLTLHEAENAFARAMVNDGVLDGSDLAVVHEEKRQTVRKSGLLEFVDAPVDLADVGGLENLKRWLAKRDGSWLAEAAAYGLPAPRGVLITGVPGCGKSLTAKAIASAWGLPLLRLDVGRVFAGLVGSSEQNMRTAIRTAEATAPCVLWIDEIEKGFVGGAGDSGTSARVFGSFLTWMQEKAQPVFVIATANDFERLPPELLRKGRFDEIFFVDLPTRAERASIWRVHLARRLRNPAVAGALTLDDALLGELAGLSEGYSGAEIEQAVVGGLFDAFAERRPLRRDDLVRALVSMVPLSVTQAERIDAVRSWADARAVAATAAEDWDLGGRPAGPSGSRPGGPGQQRGQGGRAVEF